MSEVRWKKEDVRWKRDEGWGMKQEGGKKCFLDCETIEVFALF